jgi:hypothetical protein
VVVDPQTGLETGQALELAFVLPNGYRLHTMTDDAKKFHKI